MNNQRFTTVFEKHIPGKTMPDSEWKVIDNMGVASTYLFPTKDEADKFAAGQNKFWNDLVHG